MVGEVTYGQLEKALTTFGFRRQSHPQYFILRQEEGDGIIAFADGYDNTVLRPAYRLAVESEIIARGIGTEADLNRALARARVRHRRVVVAPRSVSAPELVTAAA